MARKGKGKHRAILAQAIGGAGFVALAMDGTVYGSPTVTFQMLDASGNPLVADTWLYTSANGSEFVRTDVMAGAVFENVTPDNLPTFLAGGGQSCQTYLELRTATGELLYRSDVVDWNYSVS